MGKSENQPNDDTNTEGANKESPPQPSYYRGITPESKSLQDVFADVDEFQKKIDREWEDAKSAYQIKINDIMEDFMKKNTIIYPDDPGQERKKEPAANPSKFPEVPPSPPRAKTAALDPRIEQALAKAEKALQMAKRSKRLSLRDIFTPPALPMENGTSARRLVKRGFAGLALCALFALGAYGVFTFTGIREVNVLPYSHTTGPVIHDGKLYIADWFRKDLYIHDLKKGLPIVSVDHMPNKFVTGFAIAGHMIFSLDGFNRKILLHATTRDHSVLEKIDVETGKPVGLFWDGEDLWSADGKTNTIDRHIGREPETVKNKYHAPEDVHITAFNLVGKRLWLLDGKSREIIVYRLQDPLRQIASFDLDPFIKGGAPTGLAVQNHYIWIVTENPAQALKISRKKLAQSRPGDF